MNEQLINTLVQIILSLTEEERKRLHQKLDDAQTTPPKSLEEMRSQAFVGMWQDRSEMVDSTVYVRNLRQQHWIATSTVDDASILQRR